MGKLVWLVGCTSPPQHKKHGSHEGNEGHEGHESKVCDERRHHSNSRVLFSCGVDWFEVEAGQVCRRGHHGRCSSRVEEKWRVQICRDAQHETQEEACHCCPQGRQPVHKGAVR